MPMRRTLKRRAVTACLQGNALQATLWRNAATLVQHVWAGTRAGRNES
ncbi:hypothetical protein B5790_0978 [Bifidobacterium dentium]|uniref:Uncharacterized protein n=1 Tax=Bifidobacterium dentium JCVIHMP022 TaxID=553191 RepID=A0AB72Z045_9BIFI|nr:hypothetical protein HMPREF9003_1386 [Bifidobacterium dentium JCVIHMP022]OQM56158.1 hypothetical protein B5790_0978 [Bifidobacterium dentium]